MTVMVMMAVVMMMMPTVIEPRVQPRPPRESRGGPTGTKSGDQTKNTKEGRKSAGGKALFSTDRDHRESSSGPRAGWTVAV